MLDSIASGRPGLLARGTTKRSPRRTVPTNRDVVWTGPTKGRCKIANKFFLGTEDERTRFLAAFAQFKYAIEQVLDVIKLDDAWPESSYQQLSSLDHALAELCKCSDLLNSTMRDLFPSYVQAVHWPVIELMCAVQDGERNLLGHDATGRLLNAIENTKPFWRDAVRWLTIEGKRAKWKALHDNHSGNECGKVGEAAKQTAIESLTTPEANEWEAVRGKLLELVDKGESYTTERKLAQQLGMNSHTLVHKAISKTLRLQDWKRATKRSPKSKQTAMTDLVLEGVAQTKEPDPSERLTDDDAERAMRKLLKQTPPAKRQDVETALQGMDESRRRKALALYLDNDG